MVYYDCSSCIPIGWFPIPSCTRLPPLLPPPFAFLSAAPHFAVAGQSFCLPDSFILSSFYVPRYHFILSPPPPLPLPPTHPPLFFVISFHFHFWSRPCKPFYAFCPHPVSAFTTTPPHVNFFPLQKTNSLICPSPFPPRSSSLSHSMRAARTPQKRLFFISSLSKKLVYLMRPNSLPLPSRHA